jgi:hypothetical protein
MSKEEVHREKYESFKKDAMNEDLFIPSRIELYFDSAFHLIDMVCARFKLHIDMHKNVRRLISSHAEVFKDNTETVYTNFEELEKMIRPAQVYGSPINGKSLEKTKRIFETLEEICQEAVL